MNIAYNLCLQIFQLAGLKMHALNKYKIEDILLYTETNIHLSLYIFTNLNYLLNSHENMY